MQGRFKLLGHAGVAAGLVAMAIPAMAHHSFAAYDMRNTRQVEGTLLEFRWGAPHSSMVVEFRARNGEAVRMALVSGSPLMFTRKGFKPRDFKRGEKVRVVYHPNVNGAPGGALSSLRLSDGRTFADDEAARASPPGG